MPQVAVLFAQGFEEIEAITIVDVLRRAEVQVSLVGVDAPGGVVKGSHGVAVGTDLPIEKALGRAWDMVILPGGMPGATNLRDHPKVQELLKAQHAAGRKLGAICAAPIALGHLGLLQGKRATSYPGFEKELKGAKLETRSVVRDGAITTSRGPGTAFEFALELVADLVDPSVAAKLRQGMLVEA